MKLQGCPHDLSIQLDDSTGEAGAYKYVAETARTTRSRPIQYSNVIGMVFISSGGTN
jgi:hypothetical protein